MGSVTESKQTKWLVLLCVGIGTFLSSLNTSLTNTILPVIERALHISLGQSEWIVLIYLLILTVLLIPIGRLSDVLGHRRILLIGFALFTCAAVVCGYSKDFLCLFIGRALLAIGGSMILSVGPAVLTTTFPSNERGKALGMQVLMTYIGLSLGPLIGGGITQLFGWKFCFFITVPFGLAGLVLGFTVIKEVSAPDVKSIDIKGMLFFAIAMTAATVIFNASSLKVSSLFMLLLFIIMILSFLIFFRVEKKLDLPMMPFSLFRIRNFGFGSFGAAFNYLCFYQILFLIPFYFDRVLHTSIMKTGVIFSIAPVIMTVCSPIVGSLSDRFGARIFSMAGMACSTISLILFGIMAKTASPFAFLLLIIGLVFTGLGIGIFAAPNNSAIMGAAPREYQGAASGVVATFRYMGMIAGTTTGASLFHFILSQQKDISSQQAFLSSFSLTMWIGVIFGLIGFACAFSMDKNKVNNA